jgi:hypothetical protein
MARRPASPPPKPTDWPPEKALAALKTQANALEKLRGRTFTDAENDEQEWKLLTRNILTHGFGEDSNNVQSIMRTEGLGDHYMYQVVDSVYQNNFNLRVSGYTAVLKSSIAELELMLPEPEIAGAYETGDEYRFYKDLKMIVGFASKELFVIDNFLDTQIFDVYMENVGSSVGVRVLTRQIPNRLKSVAEKFAQRGGFELRSSNGVHDRVVFADDRCWVIGQSIKDAATNKPTYIVEHAGADTMRGIYETLWAAATSVVK